VADGARILSFPARRRKTADKILPGDVILIYVKDISAFTAAVEMTVPQTQDREGGSQPSVSTRSIVILDPVSAINPIRIKESLTIFHGAQEKASWTEYFRLSPAPWPRADGAMILRAIRQAGAGESDRGTTKYIQLGELGSASVPPLHHSAGYGEGVLQGARLLAIAGRAEGCLAWIRPALAAEGGLAPDPIPENLPDELLRFIEPLEVAWFAEGKLKAAFAIVAPGAIVDAIGRLADLAVVCEGPAPTLYIVAARELASQAKAHAMRPFMRLAITRKRIRLLFVPMEALRPDGSHGLLAKIAENCIIDDTEKLE